MKKGGVVVWIVGDAMIKKSESGSSFKQTLFFMDLGFKLHDTMIYEKNGSAFPARRTGNRYSQTFEYMFVLSKGGPPKTANLICDKPNKWAGVRSFGKSSNRDADGVLVKRKKDRPPTPDFSPRNNIWRYSTGKGYSTKDKIAFEHPAIFPEKLAEDHILTWSVEGDIVLDPFSGSGTTAKMAFKNNRKYIVIDIAEEYNKIGEQRILNNDGI
jgi:DNA modification methylase